jgi:hypothetical protein
VRLKNVGAQPLLSLPTTLSVRSWMEPFSVLPLKIAASGSILFKVTALALPFLATSGPAAEQVMVE